MKYSETESFRGQARELVAQALAAFLADTQRGMPPGGVDSATRVFGPDGILDSLGLVGFIADVEVRVAEQFGVDIVLADERAMSRSRSPFRSVEALAEFVCEQVGTVRETTQGSGP